MIPFEEALRIALESVSPLETRQVPVGTAGGLVLAADVVSDTDLPPFDRAAMDGYAVRAADLTEPGRELDVTGELSAGEEPALEVGPGECVRIFTGAAVPPGADTVVMQEITSPGGAEGRVRFAQAVKPGANIARRGEDVRLGETVLRAGTRLRAAEIALAAAGVAEVEAVPSPCVSVLSTGSELVPPGESARPGQIRDANGPALVARLSSAGFGPARFLGIARDDPAETRSKIEAGLECDCLLVSGGVSVGDRDFVPEVLRELGAEFLFTSVAVKPGKPTKFALVRGGGGKTGTGAVFGLPGNPVSALVITEFMVLPVLRKMAGEADGLPRAREGTLTRDVRKKPGRRLFAPARLAETARGAEVEPLEYHGSADLAAYSRADVIFSVPAKAEGARAGDVVEFYARED